MKIKQRKHGKLLRLNDIHSGKIVKMGDQSFYLLNEETISRVRIFGVVVDKYESIKDRKYISITVDDGSDTIVLKYWENQFSTEDSYINDITEDLENINIGDIVDIIGKVRSYEEEMYVIPEIIRSQDMDWEIYRHSQLLERDFSNKGIMSEDNQKLNSNKSDDAIVVKLLSVFDDDISENTIIKLASKSNLSISEVKTIIENLQIDGIVFCPKVGMYSKI